MENLGARRRSAVLWFILSPKKNCTSLGAGQCDLRDMLELGCQKQLARIDPLTGVANRRAFYRSSRC